MACRTKLARTMRCRATAALEGLRIPHVYVVLGRRAEGELEPFVVATDEASALSAAMLFEELRQDDGYWDREELPFVARVVLYGVGN